MAKKKTKKKVASKAQPARAGARDIGFRARKIAEAVKDAPPVCAASDCYTEVPDYGDRCGKHGQGAPFPSVENITSEDVVGAVDALAAAPLPTMADRYYDAPPHVVSAPSTDEEITTSDNAVIHETHAKLSVRAPGHGTEDTDPSPLSDARHRPGAPPEKHTYVAPEPAGRPTLPDLTGHALEFHTTHRGLLCDVALALVLTDDSIVGIRRVHDRLAGEATYLLAAHGDLDAEQCGTLTSHYWHQATGEEHAALAACDADEPPAASERLSA